MHECACADDISDGLQLYSKHTWPKLTKHGSKAASHMVLQAALHNRCPGNDRSCLLCAFKELEDCSFDCADLNKAGKLRCRMVRGEACQDFGGIALMYPATMDLI